jgi:hypothetical protein
MMVKHIMGIGVKYYSLGYAYDINRMRVEKVKKKQHLLYIILGYEIIYYLVCYNISVIFFISIPEYKESNNYSI